MMERMAKYPPLVDTVCAFCGVPIRRRILKSGLNYCNLKCKGLHQREQKPLNREQLHELYVVQGRTANDIAKMVNRDPKSVWLWLRDYGIQTRPRGSYEKVHFKKGQPSTFKGKHHTQATKELIRRIAIEQGRVPYDPAVGPYCKGKKGSETTNWKGGVTPERQAFYSSRQWKRAVRVVWKRADAKCERCGHDFRTHARKHAIHHVFPFADHRGLRANPDALALLCKDCHLFVHSKANIDREFMLKEARFPEWLPHSQNVKLIVRDARPKSLLATTPCTAETAVS
jgi:transposase